MASIGQESTSDGGHVDQTDHSEDEPTPVSSNIPMGGWPCSSAMELTRRLVDVPMRVHDPPKSDAKDRGINNLDGLVSMRRAMASTGGRRMATAAVLLMKAETTPTATIMAMRAPRGLRSTEAAEEIADAGDGAGPFETRRKDEHGRHCNGGRVAEA